MAAAAAQPPDPVRLVLPAEPPTPMQRLLWRQVLQDRAPGAERARVEWVETFSFISSKGNYANYAAIVTSLTRELLEGDLEPKEVVVAARRADTLLGPRHHQGAADATTTAEPQPWDDPTIPWEVDTSSSTTTRRRRLRCRACGSHDIDVSFRQSASGDEGMTCIALCNGCSAEWRI